jgi:hypothetical protein
MIFSMLAEVFLSGIIRCSIFILPTIHPKAVIDRDRLFQIDGCWSFLYPNLKCQKSDRVRFRSHLALISIAFVNEVSG